MSIPYGIMPSKETPKQKRFLALFGDPKFLTCKHRQVRSFRWDRARKIPFLCSINLF